jgi:LmbE family N-acetylglucosaminyl deacetylase
MEAAPGPPERALVVVAHPDDVDFGLAGTVAQWTRAGSEVAYVIVTDGSAGGSDRSVSREQMRTLRESEQRAAAAVVGVKEVRFLGYPDGALYPTMEVRRDISRVIRQWRPTRVVCQSPEIWWDRIPASHPDHRAAGEATLSAVYPDARNPFAHVELLEKEGLEPWTVGELWIMASPRMSHFVDVTDTVEAKIEALLCHATQIDDPARLETMVKGWLSKLAEMAGLPPGRYAEGFQVVGTGA